MLKQTTWWNYEVKPHIQRKKEAWKVNLNDRTKENYSRHTKEEKLYYRCKNESLEKFQ